RSVSTSSTLPPRPLYSPRTTMIESPFITRKVFFLYCSCSSSASDAPSILSRWCFETWMSFGLIFAMIVTYTIIPARLAILGHFSAASAATGPLISVPLISPSGVTSTASLSSKETRTQLSLLIGYFCLTITAPKTCLRSSAGPFLTVTVTKSPTAADGCRECLPLYLFTMAMRNTLAPVLSAHTSSAVTGRTLVIYGRNSSTPFAETALDLVPAAILVVHLDYYERNCLRKRSAFSYPDLIAFFDVDAGWKVRVYLRPAPLEPLELRRRTRVFS